MLANSQGSSRSCGFGAGTLLARQLFWLIAPLPFLLLLWDVQGRHRKVSASRLLCLAPRRGAYAPGFPAHVPGPGNFPRRLLTHEARTPQQAPPRPRAPPPPPQLCCREPGCWIPSLLLVLHFHKRAALRRAEIAAAASPRGAPRGARRPGPTRARAAPAGARPEESQRGGGGGLRAVLRGGGRGGERGWGGGRGAGTPLATAGGFASLRAATRAPPASPVAAGAGREEHGEGRSGRRERGEDVAGGAGRRSARRGHPGRVGRRGAGRAQRRQVKAPESARRVRRAEATVWVLSRPRSRPRVCAHSRGSSAFSLAAAGAADSVGFVFLWGSDADESHFLRARRKEPWLWTG